MNEYLSAFGSEYAYSSFEDYIGMSESEYDKSLAEEAQVAAKQALVYQAILEKEGITVTAEDYLSYLLVNGETEEDYNEEVEEYGTNYVAQKMIKNKAIELVKELITINEEA